MPVLQFAHEWIDPILAGAKTQTLRRKVANTVILADVVDAVNGYRKGGRPFAELEILAVDRVHLEDLTSEDAHREALPNLETLLSVLEALYPDAETFIRIRWRQLTGGVACAGRID